VALVVNRSWQEHIVSLIPRFFDPWHGRITLDGVDLRDIRLSSLRRMFLGYQEPFLLPLLWSENIAYGRPGEAVRSN